MPLDEVYAAIRQALKEGIPAESIEQEMHSAMRAHASVVLAQSGFKKKEVKEWHSTIQ